MNLREKPSFAGGQHDTSQIQIHPREHLFMYFNRFLLVALLFLAGLAFGQDEPLTKPGAINPHHGGDCNYCHSPNQNPAKTNYIAGSCVKCHSASAVDAEVHPLYHIKLTGEDITIPTDFPLVNKDSVTCITCHTMPVKFDRSNASFLRGGPYKEEIDFCYKCHAFAYCS